MKRGTVNEQFLKVKAKDKSEPVSRGPYYVLSRREGDHTASKRLKTGEELNWVRKGVEEHKKFKELCREYEDATEQLGEALRSQGIEGVEKKRLKSPSSRTKKSN
jgi:hypothetical protein